VTDTGGPFKIVAFAGASNWPYWAAEANGFFAREGLGVTLDFTPDSIEMARNLHRGVYDLALSSIDNVVAYDEGQGEADLGGPADFVALFGVDNGLLSLVSAPSITSFAALKGRTISVDALTTGFAFVLKEMLELNGLGVGDVTLAKAGGGAQRLAALLDGRQDATLLNAPLDIVAISKGCWRLAMARDMIGAYQGVVGCARRDGLASDAPRMEAFIRGFHAALRWLANPANRSEAVALLCARMKGMQPQIAERAYDRLLDPAGGIHRDLRIDRDGVRTVLRLRTKYAAPRKELTDPERYIDESLLRSALGS
jgi:ABC-type nitrate/sulfonate/bicarbonate transport system substrate-binding protein